MVLRSICLSLALLASIVNTRLHGQVSFQANSTSGCTPMGVVMSVTAPAPASITSYLWQITTPSGNVLSASSAQYIAIFSQPGNYDVSLTINGNQTATIEDYISVHALPVANFTASDPVGCFPHCIDFTDLSVTSDGDIIEWSWDLGDGSSSTQQNPTHCYNQPGNYTPVFSVEDEYGCYADITMPGLIQVVDQFPNASFTSSSQLTCNPPVDITFNNNSSDTSPLTSDWVFGDGQENSTPNTNAVTHSFTSSGTYEVCVTVTNSVGCEDETCHTITIFDTAEAEFTVSDQSVCEGEPVTFTSTSVPAPATTQWDFNGDGVVDSNSATPTYSYSSSGNFTPSLTIGYGVGCGDTEAGSTSINVAEGADVSFVADTLESCSFPFAVHFENTSAGPGTISYEWFIDGVSVGTDDNLDYTFNAYGIFDVRLVATTSTGCVTQYVANDYILVQEPQVQFDNGSSVCTDQNVPIFNVEVVSVDPVAFYFWDFNSDGVTDAEGLSPMFMYDAPGIYTITLTIETMTGCTASYTNTQNINVLVEVDAEFTSSADTTCAGQPVEFCVLNQPGNTYTWNFFDGSGWVIMPLSADCIVHEYADTGWYDLTLTVFNGACNVLQTFENFIYVQPPVALFEYQVVCGQLAADFADISIEADSIVWDFGDGSAPLSDVSNPTHQYAAPGTYTVVLTAYADGSDCPDITSSEIVVSDPDPSLSFTPDAGCPPLIAQFQSPVYYPHWEVNISNGDEILVNWNDQTQEWEIEYTQDGTTTLLTSNNPLQFDWPSITLYEGGYYDVTATVIDNNGCPVTTIYDDAIHVSANPDFASFSANAIDLCNDVTIGFDPDLDDLEAWQWIFSDGSVSTYENPFHTFNPPYNYSSPLSATLTATDSLGCVSSVTQTIDVLLPPVVNFIAASDPSCIGDAVQFLNYSTGPDGTTYSWDFGDPLSSENSSAIEEPTHVFSSNGTYEVCLTAMSPSGCSVTYCNDEAVHIVNPEVDFSFSSTINNCLYGVQFDNTTSGTTVITDWNFGDGQSGIGSSVFHTFPIGVYDVTLTVINNYGCVDSLVVPDILNYGNQVGPFTQSLDSANCAPFDIQLGAFNPADTYFSYFWDFSDGSGDPSGNTITTHTYLQAGSYCPSVIMTDPNGCPVLISCTDTIVVEEFVMAYSIPSHICFGDTLSLEVNNATTYQWDPSPFLSAGSTSNTFLLFPPDDTQFVLHGTYADCDRTDTIALVVNDLPVVSLVVPASVCFGDSLIPLNSGIPVDPPGNYTVDGVNATFFDPAMPAGQVYEVAYHYTDTFQCSNSASTLVQLLALPVVDFPTLPELCEDADTLLLNMASPGGGVYTTGSDTIQFVNPSAGYGHFAIEYTYTDNNGCINTDTSDMHIHPMPAASISFADACENEGFLVNNLSVIAEGAIQETIWDFGAGGTQNAFQPTATTFPGPGVYSFNVTMLSNHGCLSALDSSVHVHAAPVPLFTPDIACQHTSMTFLDQSTIASDTIVTWLWSTEGVQVSSPDSLVYSFSGWGDIPVSLTAISDFGCRDSIINMVHVRPAPVVDLAINDGCYGVESVFNAESTIPAGGVVSEFWDFGDGHPIEYGGVVDNLYAASGTYHITFTAVSNLGCSTILNDSLIIYELPEPDFVADATQFCAGAPIQLIDLSSVSSPSEIIVWQWTLSNGVQSSGQNPTILVESTGSLDVTLSVQSNHGCVNDTTITDVIVVYPRPQAGFNITSSVSSFEPIAQIVNTASDDVTAWNYDLGDGTVEDFEGGQHLYESIGEYEVVQVVWNTFGCSDTAVKTIEVNPSLLIHVPNAFTPDVNGHNEVFLPIMYGFDITYYQLHIFDRWGIEVFATNDPNAGWDGVYKGTPAPDGSYSWVIDVRNGADVTVHRKFGNVLLLK